MGEGGRGGAGVGAVDLRGGGRGVDPVARRVHRCGGCRRPCDERGRCWWCNEWACWCCGGLTGSALISMCAKCQNLGAADPPE